MIYKLQTLESVWIEPVRDWNITFCFSSCDILSSVNWTCEGLKLKCFPCIPSSHVSCELNLWGIETITKTYIKASESWVWIEPVRDWNLAPMLFWYFPQYSVNWTCEGLKQKSRICMLKWYMVWIEPVRDWNQTYSKNLANLQMRVNWTCEGLKHIYTWFKQIIFFTCELNLWGIETRPGRKTPVF